MGKSTLSSVSPVHRRVGTDPDIVPTSQASHQASFINDRIGRIAQYGTASEPSAIEVKPGPARPCDPMRDHLAFHADPRAFRSHVLAHPSAARSKFVRTRQPGPRICNNSYINHTRVRPAPIPLRREKAKRSEQKRKRIVSLPKKEKRISFNKRCPYREQ